jgi:hypothetical protein
MQGNITDSWNQNIIGNLRQKYGEALKDVTDLQLIRWYDEIGAFFTDTQSEELEDILEFAKEDC